MNTCKFSFSRTYAPNVVVSCEDDVCIPRAQPFTWLLSRLILTHGIPKFAESDFSDALQVFIEEEEKKFYDKSATQLYDEFLSDDSNGEKIAADLETAVDERTTSRRQLESLADEDIFGQAYARIVQSATAMDLVQLEHSFAVAVETEITERKRALEDLQKINVEETAALIAKGGSDEAVSELQRRFHADYEILKTQWDSRISELKELQRRNYRSFVMSVEEQLPQSLPRTSPPDTSRRGAAPSSNIKRLGATPLQTSKEPAKTSQRGSIIQTPMSPHEPRSESFMVELGRQLRTSYNLKLIQADPLKLITIVGSGLSGPPSESPVSPAIRTANLAERLSSALTIYSNQLTGLIILVNSQFFQSRDQRRLAEICERSTDFHFPEYDHQLAEIQDTINHLLAAGGRSNESSDSGEGRPQEGREGRPKPGEVYITRHTNLASVIGGVAGGGGGINVVFHIVCSDLTNVEDRLRCQSPLYLALSAILRVCFQYDITTLLIPLLLTPCIAEFTNPVRAALCGSRPSRLIKVIRTLLRAGTVCNWDVNVYLVSPNAAIVRSETIHSLKMDRRDSYPKCQIQEVNLSQWTPFLLLTYHLGIDFSLLLRQTQ